MPYKDKTKQAEAQKRYRKRILEKLGVVHIITAEKNAKLIITPEGVFFSSPDKVLEGDKIEYNGCAFKVVSVTPRYKDDAIEKYICVLEKEEVEK